MKAIGAYLDKAAGKALSRRSGVLGALLRNWPAIAGELASFTRPEKLSRARPPRGATLTLRVQPGRALEVQHASAELIGRINGFFGHLAVERIAFVQAPVGRMAASSGKARERAPDKARLRELSRGIDAVKNPSLRESLARLARDMARRRAHKSVDNP